MIMLPKGPDELSGNDELKGDEYTDCNMHALFVNNTWTERFGNLLLSYSVHLLVLLFFKYNF